MKQNCLYLTLFVVFFAPPSFSNDEPRAARSVHLWYPASESTWFYNEMIVDESHPGSYFMACGFSHGYFGIQEIRGPEDKVAIFSVWEPGEQDDPNIVKDDLRVKPLFEGEGVNVSRFGNEGTGGKSMFPYQWNVGETYKFLLNAKVDGKRSVYTAYFYLNEESRWKKLATFSTLAKGDHLKGYYSFVEDFWRNGESAKQVRRARYGNGWVKTLDGDWVDLTRARFTADRTPTMNINAGLIDGWYFLTTGGTTINELPLRSEIARPPRGLVLPVE